MRVLKGLAFILTLQSCATKFALNQVSTQQYSIASQSADESIETLVNPYRDSLNTRVNRVLITSEGELVTGNAQNIQPAQTAMGNFLVDACLEIAKQRAKALNKPEPDISIFTWGSIRNSLPVGNITVRHIYQVMPFENEMIVLTITGSQMRTLLHHLAKSTSPLAGAFIKKGDPNQMLVNGHPLDDTKLYRVLASDYLAFGGDSMPVLKDASEHYFCDIKVRDSLITYLENLKANGKVLVPNYEQRIVD